MTRAQILALGVQSNSRFIKASDTGEFFAIEAGQSGGSAQVISFPVTILNAPTNVTIPLPSGSGYKAGDRKVFHVKSTGGGNLVLDGAITVPGDSGVSFPKAIVANGTYIVQLNFVNSGWGISTVVGPY